MKDFNPNNIYTNLKRIIKSSSSLLFITIYACSFFEPTNEELDEGFLKLIAEEKRLWEDFGINSYEIAIQEGSVWIDLEVSLKVENDIVIDFVTKCGDSLLDVDGEYCNQIVEDINEQRYTIEGLFAQIQDDYKSFIIQEESAYPFKEIIEIKFDEKYHFPRYISLDHPDWADEEYSIGVIYFSELDE